MNADDYINLQTLLAKLRVETMKEYGNLDVDATTRQRDLRVIRNIDYIRNNTILNLYGGADMEVKMTMEEYKELENIKEKHEALEKEIKGCTKIYQEAAEAEDEYINVVAEIDSKKLEKVLLKNIKFSNKSDIDKIRFLK